MFHGTIHFSFRYIDTTRILDKKLSSNIAQISTSAMDTQWKREIEMLNVRHGMVIETYAEDILSNEKKSEEEEVLFLRRQASISIFLRHLEGNLKVDKIK